MICSGSYNIIIKKGIVIISVWTAARGQSFRVIQDKKSIGFIKYKTGETVNSHPNDLRLFQEFHSEAKERAPSTFQLQPIIITQARDSSVLLYLALVSIYPNATLNKQHLMGLLMCPNM